MSQQLDAGEPASLTNLTTAIPVTRRAPNLLVPGDYDASLLAALAELADAHAGDLPDEEWSEKGICAQTDPETFFPEKGGSTREAKRICADCEVRAECLEYALEQDERFGIWGGLSYRERRTLRRGQPTEATR